MRNIIKKSVVVMLKKIEKWASFLLSLFEENSVNNASKLVPIFAPNTSGIASYTFIAPLIASIWISAIKRLDDCSAPVNNVATIRLIKKLLVVFLMYSKIIGLSFIEMVENEIKNIEKNRRNI